MKVDSTPEICVNEWVTFSTKDFPENRTANPGDVVRIVTTDYSDNRPVEDILWPHDSYQAVFREAGLQERSKSSDQLLQKKRAPLGFPGKAKPRLHRGQSTFCDGAVLTTNDDPRRLTSVVTAGFRVERK